MLCLFKWIQIISTFLLRKFCVSYFRVNFVEKQKFFRLKLCVLQPNKFILVSFLHSESLFSCIPNNCLQTTIYTVFVSSLKCVSRVKANILSDNVLRSQMFCLLWWIEIICMILLWKVWISYFRGCVCW